MEEIKGELNFKILMTHKFNLILIAFLLISSFNFYKEYMHTTNEILKYIYAIGSLFLLVFIIASSVNLIANPVKIFINDNYIKFIKGEEESIIKWVEINKLVEQYRSIGILIYDKNNKKYHIDFKTTNFANIKAEIFKKCEEIKSKTT